MSLRGPDTNMPDTCVRLTLCPSIRPSFLQTFRFSDTNDQTGMNLDKKHIHNVDMHIVVWSFRLMCFFFMEFCLWLWTCHILTDFSFLLKISRTNYPNLINLHLKLSLNLEMRILPGRCAPNILKEVIALIIIIPFRVLSRKLIVRIVLNIIYNVPNGWTCIYSQVQTVKLFSR